MADTNVATGLKVQQWDDKFFVEALNANIFKPFMGKSSNSVIQLQEDLTKHKGDAITFALVNKLTNDPVTGTAVMEGNEEDMDSRSFKVTVDRFRNAVRVDDLDEQFSAIPLREAAKDTLVDWSMELDRDKIIAALASINGVVYGSATEAQKDAWLVDNADRVLFGALLSNNSGPGDHSAALANIDNTADKLTASAITLLKRIAKTATPKIRPLKPRKGGVTSDSYILYVPSLVLRDLTQDSAFLQANREARERGKHKNPIFLGADYIYDNVAVIEVEDIEVISGVGAGSIDVAPVYLCGAQAVAMAWARRDWTKAKDFDYGVKKGVQVAKIYQIAKMLFGSGSDDTDDLQDHGVVTGYFASVADS